MYFYIPVGLNEAYEFIFALKKRGYKYFVCSTSNDNYCDVCMNFYDFVQHPNIIRYIRIHRNHIELNYKRCHNIIIRNLQFDADVFNIEPDGTIKINLHELEGANCIITSSKKGLLMKTSDYVKYDNIDQGLNLLVDKLTFNSMSEFVKKNKIKLI